MSKMFQTGKKNPIHRRIFTSYFTSVISIALVLFLIGLIGLLALNAKQISDYVKENIGFSIILNETAKEADIIRLQKELDASNYIKSTKYISKEEAAKEFQEELGEDFISILGYNPLLAFIDARLKADFAKPDSIAKIKSYITSFSLVKEVIYQESLVQQVYNNVKKISFIISIFCLLLFILASALISNTIRLMMYSKRFLIKTMQQVGATDSFIRKPFLLKSIFHGTLGAMLALIFLYFFIFLLHNEFDGIIYLTNLGLLTVLLILSGNIISVSSTWISVNRYLETEIDELYY